MNLSKIAIRFNNISEREQIENIFKREGYKVTNMISKQGEIGYSDVCKYVCVLTEAGLVGKTILTLEEFTKATIKHLPINKDHKNEHGIIVHFNSTDETIVKIVNTVSDVLVNINVGKYGTTIKRANEIIRLFDRPYILIESTDWSKVEVGVEITWTETAIVYEAPNGVLRRLGKLHSYVPELDKIIAICGKELIVIDESEVSLCN